MRVLWIWMLMSGCGFRNPRTWRFRPLVLAASQGSFVNILRVRRSGILSRHRHAGAVHAFTLRGRWHYLEYDWWAEQGSYAFEPPGTSTRWRFPRMSPRWRPCSM